MSLLPQPPPESLVLLLLRLAAIVAVWYLLPDQYQEVLTRKIVLCIGLWQLSCRTTTTTTKSKTKTLTKQSSLKKLDDDKPKQCSRQHRQVSFGQMEILEFPSLLGDNPSVKEGAPLTLDWTPVRKSIHQVDLVADKRGPHRAPRVLTPSERELLLLSKGYSLLEIEQASYNVHSDSPPSRPNPFANFKSRVRKLVHHKRQVSV